MSRIVPWIFVGVVTIHGLIHLLGLVAYWPLATVSELPYKTTFLGGRWDVGAAGMRVFAVLWLVSALGFVVAAGAHRLGQPWWLGIMIGSAILSLAITLLDWSNARIGALISGLLLVILVVALGLRATPAPFPPASLGPLDQDARASTAGLPPDLPAPVVRYYQAIGADPVPAVESAVITARGTTRFAGLTLQARLLFIHDAGSGYRHYIESTVYGVPVLKVNERYIDGAAVLELPFGKVENEPKVDMAANLGLWGESIWLPSVFVTDERVWWEAIDERTARLSVPFGAETDAFTVHFDPTTDLISRMEAMRYKGAADTAKTLWILDVVEWADYNGLLVPSVSTATWADEGTPWLVVEIDDLRYNVDVGDYISQRGN